MEAKAGIQLSLVLFTLISCCLSFDPFISILGDASSCQEKCLESYPGHTYDEPSNTGACERGCRLFTVTHLLRGDLSPQTNQIHTNEVSLTRQMCNSACAEAYGETSDLTDACGAGCEIQDSLQKSQMKKGLKEELESELPSLLRPMIQVREFASRASGLFDVMQTSLTTFFMKNDDKSVVAIEGPTKLIIRMRDPEEPSGRSQLPPFFPPFPILREEVEEGDRENTANEVDEERILPDIFRVKEAFGVEPLTRNVENGVEAHPVRDTSDENLFDCISRRVGMPSSLLLTSVTLFVICNTYFLYLVCKSPSKKKVVQSDNIPPPTKNLPIKLVLPEDLTKLSLYEEEEGLQAPPLPIKKMPDTNV